MLGALPASSVTTQTVPAANYESKLDSLKKRSFLVDGTKGEDCQGRYFYPWIMEGKFSTFNIPTNDGKTHPIKATKYMSINYESMNQINLIDEIRAGRFVCIERNNGKIENIYIHTTWFKKIMQEDALEVVVRNAVGEQYGHPDENDDITLVEITQDVYIKEVKELGYGDFL